MELGLEGKLCLVTGGTRGIGAASARLLAAEGARVLTVARGEADIELDVSQAGAGERLLAVCPQPPWALVNNAGTSRARPLEELTDADWNEQWELHVMAPLRLVSALAPAMAEAGGGRVVNVASSSGKRPSQTLDAAYSVTKTAELALSRVLAERWGPEGVLVNAVAPGPVETPLWTSEGGLADELAERSGRSREEVLAATHAKSLLGRMGREEEVAAAIVFLCSLLASNVVGAAWSVDGGSTPSIF
jgi:3-oxoacyl-[acyl-carrier protein] reductase